MVDKQNRFVGVITSGVFLRNLRAGAEEVFVNTNCSVIAIEEDNVIEKAEKLFCKYRITTAIPVINKSGEVCYEVRMKRENHDQKIVEKFYDKLMLYERSHYLKQEIFSLWRLLETQNIVIVGTEKQFEAVLGKAFQKRDRLTFVQTINDPFSFLHDNIDLLIDVSITAQSGRRDIYRICNIGYGWYEFLNHIVDVVEKEECSRFYRIIDNDIVTIKDYLKEYSDGKIAFSQRDIFTNGLVQYLRRNNYQVIEEKSICRDASLRLRLRANGIESDKTANWNESILFFYVDIMLQFAHFYVETCELVSILSFSLSTEVELTDNEKSRMIDGKYEFSQYVSDVKNGKRENCLYHGQAKELEYLQQIERFQPSRLTRRFENDLLCLKDQVCDLVNIENGIRKTCYQPAAYIGTIYFLGVCTIYGHFVEDRYTIPSLIQKYLNDSDARYRAVNLGMGIPVDALRLQNMLKLKEKDIIVLVFPYMTDGVKEKIPVIECGNQFNEIRRNKYREKECFIDLVPHCGDYANMIYSEIIYEELKKYLVITNTVQLEKNSIYNVFEKNEADLDVLYGFTKYKSYLEKERNLVPMGAGNIGCIVMNCNPFTLGHRYLVEYALKQVDYVYVFVVEEDKSYFSFRDRFTMVKNGLSDLKNVSVVRSGNFVISSKTFPVYFQKEKIQKEANICVYEDLRIFAQYVSPILNIRHRFVGEEPEDYVTNKYNEAMKKILPQFDICVTEIPRKYIDGQVISASKVRKAYQEKDYKNMKRMVPYTTLEYLWKKIYALERSKNDD